MRDLVFFLMFSSSILLAFRLPFVGILIWTWVTIAAPQISTYQFSSSPINVVVALVVFLSFLLHGEYKKIVMTPTVLLIFGFSAWILVSQIFSLDHEGSYRYADRFFKVMIFVILCTQAMTTKLRFHAILWVFIYIMAFFGIKGGFYTIILVAQGTYYGHESTMLYDNNHIGIALAMSIPIFLYMFEQTKWKYLKLALLATIILSALAVLGTHSRGAFISLVVFASFMWLRSSRKLVTAIIVVAIAIPAINFMPEKWTERMNTIRNAEQDSSFLGRVDAWVINYKLAKQNPFTGAGLRNPYNKEISQIVDLERTPRAAHSIYFEVLGGMGFIGLLLYLSIFASGFLEGRHIMKKYRDAPEERWRSRFGYHIQTSILVFCIGGASVSLEMWEGYLMLLALVGVARKVAPVYNADALIEKMKREQEMEKRAALGKKKVEDEAETPEKPKYIKIKDRDLYKEIDRFLYQRIDTPQ